MRHLLSLLATGLALALGVGLGAGPIAQESVTAGAADRQRLRAQVDRLAARADGLARQARTDARLVRELAAPLLGDRLEGRTVVLVAAPGAARSDVRQVHDALTDAGAGVTATVRLTQAYVDPAGAQSPLEDLALRLVPPGVEFRDGAEPIERVGTVLARAVTQRPDGGAEPVSEVDQDAAEVIAGFEEIGALRLDGVAGERAELAVLLTGTEGADAEAALTGLAAALDAGSRGAVVVGPGAAREGPLRWVREASGEALSGVATVDSVSSAGGQVALLLAVAEQVGGGSGHYGSGRRAGSLVPGPAPSG